MLPLSVLSKLQSALDEIESAKSALSDELARIHQAIAEYDANAIKLRTLIVEFSSRGIEQAADIQSSIATTQEPGAVVLPSPPEDKSIRNAMVEILRETKRPMQYRTEITPALQKQGLLGNVKSPKGTVNAHLGHDKRFRRTPGRPGYWELISWSLQDTDTTIAGSYEKATQFSPSGAHTMPLYNEEYKAEAT